MWAFPRAGRGTAVPFENSRTQIPASLAIAIIGPRGVRIVPATMAGAASRRPLRGNALELGEESLLEHPHDGARLAASDRAAFDRHERVGPQRRRGEKNLRRGEHLLE